MALNLQRDLGGVKAVLGNGQGELLLTPKEIDKKLNTYEDKLGDEPVKVLDVYEDVKAMSSAFLRLNGNAQVKLLGLLSNSFRKLVNLMEVCLKSNDLSEAVDLKSACEVYSFLLYGLSVVADGESASDGRKNKNNLFEWDHIKLQIAETIKTLLSLAISRLYESRVDSECVVSCVVKLAHSFLEKPDTLKHYNLKNALCESLALAVREQSFGSQLKTIVIQDLNYFDHLSQFSAELLNILICKFDDAQLAEDIIRDIGGLQFGANETAAAHIISEFLVHLTDLNSKTVLKCMPFVIPLMDCDSHTIRMALLETIGKLCKFLTQQERTDQTSAQLKSLFAVLEERFYDVNSFVRARLLHVLADLCRSHSLPIHRRFKILSLVIERVMDKSSNVRKKAVQMLAELIRAHPFGVDGGELDLLFFQSRLKDIDGLLAQVSADPTQLEMSPGSPSSPKSPISATEDVSPTQVNTLLMQKKYYSDAVKFVEQLDRVIPILTQLLSSTIKTEVFEVMDFFVDAHLYKLKSAIAGVKKMVHLVWEKDLSSEDGTKRSVKDHLLACYQKLFLEPDERVSGKEKILSIVNGLLEMLDNVNLAELTSIDELLQLMVRRKMINEPVIQALYSMITPINPRARPAVLLFSMICKADKGCIEKRLDGLVRAGLGELGEADPLIAQYTCQAVQSLSLATNDKTESVRLPNDNILCSKLISFIQTICDGPQWFQTITEAINAVYLLADRPDVLCSDLIKGLVTRTCVADHPNNWSQKGLSKLIFIVGQVALQHNMHLDSIERHWKAQQQLNKQTNSIDNIEEVTGTAEDEIVQIIKEVKENELLYGEKSLLRVFGPVVSIITMNNLAYNDKTLQRVASLALCKFMSVSGRFCEENLGLFLTVLQHSPDPIIRSNLVIGFGDLAQSFNSIVETNLSHLFARLHDNDPSVRRNTMMVLTHLTLTGMIKVKGQIGEIAGCLEDEDLVIRNLAKTFFTELASRDNAIYNHLPDIISSLSEHVHSGEDPDKMARILKFVFEFIKKDRQIESLVEKLCIRLRQTDDIGQQRSTAHCLALLPLNTEKAILKLVEALPYYQDKLVDEQVYKWFSEIAAKNKKQKPEIVEEWEAKMRKAAGGEMMGKVVKEMRRMSLDNVSAAGVGRKQTKAKSKTGFYRPSLDDSDSAQSDLENATEQTQSNLKTRSRRIR